MSVVIIRIGLDWVSKNGPMSNSVYEEESIENAIHRRRLNPITLA